MLLSHARAIPPTTERYTWVTQVIESYNGHEERHVVRLGAPRMNYNVTVPLLSLSAVTDQKTRDDQLREGVQFALWHALYDGEARLATIRGHPWYFEFGTKVGHYFDGNLTVSDSVRGVGDIYPVLDAIVLGGLRYTIRRGGGTAVISYNVQQAVTPPTGTFETLDINGVTYEVLELPTRSGFQQVINQQQGFFDSVVGKYIETTRWNRPKLQWNYTIEMFDPDEILFWKQFLFRRQGRYAPVALRDTDGRAIVMRLATDTPSINYGLNYFTSTVPFKQIFVS